MVQKELISACKSSYPTIATVGSQIYLRREGFTDINQMSEGLRSRYIRILIYLENLALL